MPFRVFWAPNAELAIERFLRESPTPEQVAASAREIDHRLANSPLEFGESRYDMVRLGFIFPLGVQVEVMSDIYTDIVHNVWRIDRP